LPLRLRPYWVMRPARRVRGRGKFSVYFDRRLLTSAVRWPTLVECDHSPLLR
jgi:hypothetical protein